VAWLTGATPEVTATTAGVPTAGTEACHCGALPVGRRWRQVAQAVEAGTLWGGGLGVWAQNVWSWCNPEFTL